MSKLWFFVWLIIFLVTFAWRAQNLGAFGLSNDEGAHLMWARLAVEGYPLYSETQAVQAPLFLEWIGLSFRLAGITIQAGRVAILVAGFGLLSGALSWLAYRAGGWLAAVMAMLLLGLAPLIFTFSRLAMAEVPATGLAVLSLALLFVFLDKGRLGWLVASGVVMGLSLLTKALHPFMVAPVGFLLLVYSHSDRQNESRLRRWQKDIVAILGWGVGVLIPLLAVLFIYEPAALYDQLVAFRGDLRTALPGSWAETWTQFATFFVEHWGFWLLAFGGIIWTILPFSARHIRVGDQAEARSMIEKRDGFRLPFSYAVVWLVWLVAGIAMLLWHTPLFQHHFIVLLPPLILLGAGYVAEVVVLWRQQPGAFLGLVLALIIAAAALNIPAVVQANQKMASIVTGGRETEALTLLKAVSNPDDFLMGDSQQLIFMADRRTPPPLGDVALVAIKAGRQTSTRLIEINQAYQAPAVVQWSLRLPWLPEYLTWVEANYLARRVWDDDHIIYFAPRFPSGQPVPNADAVQLSNKATLRGYQIEKIESEAGHTLNLKVYWQADVPLAEDYTVFTQLLDAQGNLVVGWDSQPLGGYFPTSRWPAHEIVTDGVQLSVPADLPPGDYQLITGLYFLDTLERLLDAEGKDYISLATIRLNQVLE